MNDIQTVKLGRADAQAPVALTGIDKMGERLGRRVRALLEPMLGAKPLVAVQNAEMVNFDLWSAMAPGFCALSVYRLAPLKGSMLLRMDPAMVTAVVDRFYGGSGGKPSTARTEFTQSEERIIARMADGVVAALAASWADMIELDCGLVARETDPQALSFAESTDQMLVQTIDVKLGRDEHWAIELMFPMVALRQIEPLLSSGPMDDARMTDPLWRVRMADAMQSIRLPARTVLARPSLTVAELLALKPGDVIPVNITRKLPLIVGNRVIAHGTIGEQNGRAAFRIETNS